MIPQPKKYFQRTLEETLDAWYFLESLNRPISEERMKEIMEIAQKIEEKVDYTEEDCLEMSILEDQLAQSTYVRLTKADIENFDKGIITKKRINQLDNLLRYKAIPRCYKDRQDLFTLLKYGQVYPFSDDPYWRKKNTRELKLIARSSLNGESF